MKFNLVVLGMFLGVSASAGEVKSVPVVTVDGQTVQVTPSDLTKAYGDLQELTEAINVRYENTDGSVIIVEPRFRLKGKVVRLSTSFSWGVCKTFGLGERVAVERAEGVHGEVIVKVWNNGSLAGSYTWHSSLADSPLSSVTCRK